MNAGDGFQADAAGMRWAFDQTFARPEPAAVERDDFVTVRVGGRPFALRVAELSRVEVGRKVVPLPGAHPWLLGLAGLRGRLVPVYDLGLPFGLGRAGANPWVAVCGEDAPLGFAFDALESYLRVPRADVIGVAGGDVAHAQRAIRVAGAARPVIHLPSALVIIRRAAQGET